MLCEILTSFSGAMGSFSRGGTAEVGDKYVEELTRIGWVKPVGKKPPKKRNATKKPGDVPEGEGD